MNDNERRNTGKFYIPTYRRYATTIDLYYRIVNRFYIDYLLINYYEVFIVLR